MPPTLRRGSRNPDVARLQALLNAVLSVAEMRAAGVNNPPLRLDRDFGVNTEKAVYAFQAREGLQQDGVVGPNTWARLEQVANRSGNRPGTNPPAAGGSSPSRPAAGPSHPPGTPRRLYDGEIPRGVDIFGPPPASIEDQMKFTEHYEARILFCYRDSVGVPTVGIGHAMHRNDSRAQLAKVGADYDLVLAGVRPNYRSDPPHHRHWITDDQALSLFRDDLQIFRNTARRHFPGFDNFPKPVQLMMTDMCYNLGSLTGWPIFRRQIAAHQWGPAADNMESSLWYSQVGRRSRGLVRIMRAVAAGRNSV